MTDTRAIDTDGATQYIEVRGHGDPVFIIGSPMDAGPFTPLAEALASDHTVITIDPRGIGRSVLADPAEATTVDRRADDVIAIMRALDLDTAHLIGSSGGAVTGLSVVARYPGRIRTFIAHEPPLLELLPDAA